MKSVSLSKDGKNFQISWPDGKKSETKLLSADKVNCVYKHELKEEADSRTVVTGCENEVRYMQVVQKNHPPFYGKIHPDGRVEEIEMPPVKDKLMFPDDVRPDKNQTNDNSKSKGLRNLGGLFGGVGSWLRGKGRGGGRWGRGGGGWGGGGGLGGGGGSNAKLPECMEMEVYLYYGPSFERLAGPQAEAKAKRIASHAEAQFLHPEFGTKIFITTVLQKLPRDTHSLNQVSNLVPRQNLRTGRLHAFLVNGAIGSSFPQPGTSGIAWVGSLCGK